MVTPGSEKSDFPTAMSNASSLLNRPRASPKEDAGALRTLMGWNVRSPLEINRRSSSDDEWIDTRSSIPSPFRSPLVTL
jgi:hypothetical protein